jgi:hypothetical protein
VNDEHEDDQPRRRLPGDHGPLDVLVDRARRVNDGDALAEVADRWEAIGYGDLAESLRAEAQVYKRQRQVEDAAIVASEAAVSSARTSLSSFIVAVVALLVAAAALVVAIVR